MGKSVSTLGFFYCSVHCTGNSPEIAVEICLRGGMDEPSVKTENPKLEELTHSQLIVLLEEAMERNKIVGEKAQRNAFSQYGVVPAVLGRSEFGLEIVLSMAHQFYALGLSFDKAIAIQKFFQNLDLEKSQVDAMLHQLSRV